MKNITISSGWFKDEKRVVNLVCEHAEKYRAAVGPTANWSFKIEEYCTYCGGYKVNDAWVMPTYYKNRGLVSN